MAEHTGTHHGTDTSVQQLHSSSSRSEQATSSSTSDMLVGDSYTPHHKASGFGTQHGSSHTIQEHVANQQQQPYLQSNLTDDMCTSAKRVSRHIVDPSSTERELELLDLSYFNYAGLQPPVTVGSLNELNLDRILGDAKLRHDLNFDRDVSFRPNYDGPRGAQKKEASKQYWAALSIEFAIYMRVALLRDSSCLNHFSSPPRFSWRLRNMFTTIRDILKTLVKAEDAESIDQMLDVNLLMQQLENGVCDLVAVGQWLGTVIKGSCSPVRDAFVSSIVEQIEIAVSSCDPSALSYAIEQLFSILEIMKLDVANHQIRGLRVPMISQTVQFSQQHFSQLQHSELIHGTGHSQDNAFVDSYKAFQLYSNSSLGVDKVQVLGNLTTDMVSGYYGVTHTFGLFDMQRLCDHQQVFYAHTTCKAIAETFIETTDWLSSAALRRVSPSQTTIDNLIQRTKQLEPWFFMRYPHGRYSSTDSFNALNTFSTEIIRTAYQLFGFDGALPSDELLGKVNVWLEMNLDIRTHRGRIICETLKEDFRVLLNQEIKAMRSMNELEMLSYCERAAKHLPHSNNVEMAAGRCNLQRLPAQTQSPSDPSGLDSLQLLAIKLAHITTLHWRVWGPILYEKTLEEVRDTVDKNDRDEDKSHYDPEDDCTDCTDDDSADDSGIDCDDFPKSNKDHTGGARLARSAEDSAETLERFQ